MSTNYDFWEHWARIAQIGKLTMEQVRPLTLSLDTSINAPDLLDPLIIYRIKAGYGVIVSRIEAFTHSVNLQSVPAVFDISAIIEIHAQGSTQNKVGNLANAVANCDYVLTFNPGDVMELVFTEIGGPGVYRAFFRMCCWLIPQEALPNFTGITTISS